MKWLWTLPIFFALGACSHPSMGTIIGKRYEPERTFISCTLAGKVTICVPRIDDEDWIITLRNGEEEWDVEVTKEYYEKASNGNSWKEIK